MGAAGIETGVRLQDGVDAERLYAQVQKYKEGALGPKKARTSARAKRMFLERDGRMLKLLEQGAVQLQKINDEQKSRFKQEGHDEYASRSGEFLEFQVWRNAYSLMDSQDEQYRYRQFELYQYIYMVVADAILGPL